MKATTAAEYLLARLDEQRASSAESVITGRATEAEYHRLCGVIQGIDFAKMIIIDLATKVEEEDE
ncbi:MAG: hypothetical protein WCO52_06075 [bacterium]